MYKRKAFLLGGLLTLIALVGVASYNPVVGPVINNTVEFRGKITIVTNITYSPFSSFSAAPTVLDFTSGNAPNGFSLPVLTTGVYALTFGEAGHFGMVNLSTGAGAGGASGICSTGGNVGVVGGRKFVMFYRFRTPTALADVTDNYTLILGGSDRTTITTMQWGMWVSYNYAVNSGQWVVNTGAASINSVNSTTAVAAATWYDLLIVANAAATQVDFHISTDYGVTWSLIQSSTSQIPDGPPSGGQDTFGPYASITKSAGTNARILTIDTMGWGYFNE